MLAFYKGAAPAFLKVSRGSFRGQCWPSTRGQLHCTSQMTALKLHLRMGFTYPALYPALHISSCSDSKINDRCALNGGSFAICTVPWAGSVFCSSVFDWLCDDSSPCLGRAWCESLLHSVQGNPQAPAVAENRLRLARGKG